VLGDTLRAIILDRLRDSSLRRATGTRGKDFGQFEDEVVKSSTLARVINANSGANIQENAFSYNTKRPRALSRAAAVLDARLY
jgi:hypothetical protein